MEASNRILHSYLRVSRKMSEELRGHVGKCSLTFPQTMALTLLHEEGPMPISNLASATGSANSTISGVVDRLEKVGLIQRIRSEQDRRVIYVATTEKFEQLYSEAANTVLGDFEALVSTLSEEDLQQVEKGLSILEQALTAGDAQE